MVDDYTRECLALVADISLSGARVARELTRLIGLRGKPRTVVRDKGTELTSSAILRWSQERQVEWHYIAPGSGGTDTERPVPPQSGRDFLSCRVRRANVSALSADEELFCVADRDDHRLN